jgi:diguanylate cyclase (GGDEF)-like protein
MRRLGLVSRFAVLSAVLIAVLGFVLARIIGTEVTNRNLASARETAVIVSRVGVQSQLSPGRLARGFSPTEIVDLNRSLQPLLADHDIARIKIWNPDSRVVYSDDASIIGRRFPSDNGLDDALGGETSSEVSDLNAAENTQDRSSDDRLLEVYTPIRFGATDRPAGAFEIYLPYAPIAAGIHHDVLQVWVVLIAGLALLWAALSRIVLGASRRLQAHMRRNEYQSSHDPLTDLLNRRRFDEQASVALRDADGAHSHVAVLLMDVNRFRDVNDVLGHSFGDVVLQEIAGRLIHAVDGAPVARLGGDEFAVLLPSVSGTAAATDIANRLLDVFREPFTLDSLPVELEASIGVAMSPEHGTDASALLQRADIARYEAKRAHSGVEIFTGEHDASSRSRLTMLGELRRAIENDELLLYYQPQLDLRTGGVSGFEALLRWKHPVRGVIAPGEFLPLAEHTGLMRPLTRRVLELAARQSREWRTVGVRLPISVNLSASNLHDADLPNFVSGLLEAEELPADAFTFEITESVIMHDAARATAVVRELRGLGARISIDDFGTGYSSFAYLQQLAVDEIKVDMSFVIGMVDNPDDATIVRTTIGLGHNLRLEVVAEGVETSDALAMLREMGCDIVQGYWLSRPLPGPDALEWFRRHARSIPAPRGRFSSAQ